MTGAEPFPGRPGRPVLVGHRGARALAPENTLTGVAAAGAAGAGAVEVDVHLTRDEVVALHHDAAVSRDLARDARGRWLEHDGPPIHATDWADLQGFDMGRARPGSPVAARFPGQAAADGARIPRLEAVLAACAAAGLAVLAEVKSDPAVPARAAAARACALAVARLAQGRDAPPVAVLSFDWSVLAALAAAAPAVPRGYLTRAGGAGEGAATFAPDSPWIDGRVTGAADAPGMVVDRGGALWLPHFADLDPDVARAAQGCGLRFGVWTVNGAGEAARCAALGASAIITDDPGAVAPALARR